MPRWSGVRFGVGVAVDGNVNCGWVGRLGFGPPCGESTRGEPAGANHVGLAPVSEAKSTWFANYPR